MSASLTQLAQTGHEPVVLGNVVKTAGLSSVPLWSGVMWSPVRLDLKHRLKIPQREIIIQCSRGMRGEAWVNVMTGIKPLYLPSRGQLTQASFRKIRHSRLKDDCYQTFRGLVLITNEIIWSRALMRVTVRLFVVFWGPDVPVKSNGWWGKGLKKTWTWGHGDKDLGKRWAWKKHKETRKTKAIIHLWRFLFEI